MNTPENTPEHPRVLFKFNHANEWLEHKIQDHEMNKDPREGRQALAGMLRSVATILDGDQVQDIFQQEMDADGFFNPTYVDQYGDQVPNDLVLLPDYDDLDDEEVKTVLTANWYQPEGRHGCLMASARDLGDLSELDPADADVDLTHADTRIDRVDNCLKRGNPQDGFYHA